jgi:hypothetical protein
MYLFLLSAWCIYRLNFPPPPDHLTESHHCMVLLKAPVNAHSHVTLLRPQLPFNFIIFQMMFLCHCMIKWNYHIWIHYELTENWMHSVSQLRCKCLIVTIEKGKFSCSCNGRAWHWCRKQRIFSPVSFEFPYFHFSVPQVKRFECLKSSKNVNLMSRITKQGF